MATKFIIFRYNPDEETKPRHQEYMLDIPDGATLLDCINLIKWTQDGTLSFRMSCRSAICGSCAMKVNGHARLTCKTQAVTVVEDGTVKIDPLGNFEIIKDLIVDMEPFWSSLENIEPWLVPDESIIPERERLMTHEDQKKIDAASTCILCAACFSDCNVLEVDKKFFGPATLAKAQRFVYDTRDCKTDVRLERLSDLNGMWDCTTCAECSTRCPTEAKPLSRIRELKEMGMKRGFRNNHGARHVLAFRESIGTRIGGGYLNENYIPARSVGFFNIGGLLSLLPIGVRMFMRGKNPPLLPHLIEKFGEVKKMFGRFGDYLK
ncbi:MAG: succinate dehydrogenase iron-sulfur subunit [Nitrospinota bacterium]